MRTARQPAGSVNAAETQRAQALSGAQKLATDVHRGAQQREEQRQHPAATTRLHPHQQHHRNRHVNRNGEQPHEHHQTGSMRQPVTHHKIRDKPQRSQRRERTKDEISDNATAADASSTSCSNSGIRAQQQPNMRIPPRTATAEEVSGSVVRTRHDAERRTCGEEAST